MAKTKVNSKKSSSLKANKKVNLKLIIPLVLAVALVGGLLVFRSFAGASTYKKTYIDNNGPDIRIKSEVPTNSVLSRDGWLCVESKLNKYNTPPLVSTSYRWRIQETFYDGHSNIGVTSKTFSANGNSDKQCFDNRIYSGRTYRIVLEKFQSQAHGYVYLYGYKR